MTIPAGLSGSRWPSALADKLKFDQQIQRKTSGLGVPNRRFTVVKQITCQRQRIGWILGSFSSRMISLSAF